MLSHPARMAGLAALDTGNSSTSTHFLLLHEGRVLVVQSRGTKGIHKRMSFPCLDFIEVSGFCRSGIGQQVAGTGSASTSGSTQIIANLNFEFDYLSWCREAGQEIVSKGKLGLVTLSGSQPPHSSIMFYLSLGSFGTSHHRSWDIHPSPVPGQKVLPQKWAGWLLLRHCTLYILSRPHCTKWKCAWMGRMTLVVYVVWG